MAIVLAVEGSQSPNGQSLEYSIRPYVGYLTFGIDIAAGIIIAISAATAVFAFFKIIRKKLVLLLCGGFFVKFY